MEANPVPKQKGKYGHGLDYEETKNKSLNFGDRSQNRD